MHKRLVNEAVIGLTISPLGPILIKAGESGADPTRPDMEFVRTWHGGEETLYLPGSSLKGVLRAHCERIARTVDDEEQARQRGRALSCDPLDGKLSCSGRWEEDKKRRKREKLPELTGMEIHSDSCSICQMFGNTSLASHFRIADAYPVDSGQVKTEERNGVAIDRVFGSVAVGPFQFEVVTQGDFRTTLTLKNFTLAQLGLLALALRDLSEGRVSLGFAKSRGLGRVTAHFDALALRYPLAERRDGQIYLVGRAEPAGEAGQLVGVGAFLADDERRAYGYPEQDWAALPATLSYGESPYGELELALTRKEDIENVWRACVPKWREAV